MSTGRLSLIIREGSGNTRFGKRDCGVSNLCGPSKKLWVVGAIIVIRAGVGQ